MSFGLGPNPPPTNSLNTELFGIMKTAVSGVPLEGKYCSWSQIASFKVPIVSGTNLPENMVISEKNCVIVFNNNRGQLLSVKVCGSCVNTLVSCGCFFSDLEMPSTASAGAKYTIYAQAFTKTPKLFILKCGNLQCTVCVPNCLCLSCGQIAISGGGKYVVAGARCPSCGSSMRLVVLRGSPGGPATLVKAVEGCFSSYSKVGQVCYGPFSNCRRRAFVDECGFTAVGAMSCIPIPIVTAKLDGSCLKIVTQPGRVKLWQCGTGISCHSLTGRYAVYIRRVGTTVYVVKDGKLLASLSGFAGASVNTTPAVSWSGKYIAVFTTQQLTIFKGS